MKTVAALALTLASMAVGLSQDTKRDDEEHYRKLIRENQRNSEAHYRLGEILFERNNYQESANEFREALNGDLKPAWTEVWSHISLGKIFDTTSQRERAMNEYRLARETKDNTRGAQEEAAKYLKEPYQRKQ
jgi:tetratricopeptide (TPR) repeat protein